MSSSRRTAPELAAVLAELRAREPIFHRPEHGASRADFERMTEPTFWETGASGRVHDRAFVLDELERRATLRRDDPWETRDFACQELAPDLFLLTYELAQGPRVTRRATLWRRAAGEWRIVYHQGTVVAEPAAGEAAPDARGPI